MSETNLNIFRYSTILTLTKAGICTIDELDRMTDAEIAAIRGIGARSYNEIMEKLGRTKSEDKA